MCALFGLYDYGDKLNSIIKTKLIRALGQAAEVRGTDASGISYVRNGRLVVYKRPFPAHKMMFRVADSTVCVMGHTRMTTQGNEQFNQNNHPFIGESDVQFSLAHNGIICNDVSLKCELKLPTTSIETDSYIAVQLIEVERKLNMSTLIKIAEQLEGSFTLTVLDQRNRLYLIKGNNPLAICKIPSLSLYVYASTAEILAEALRKCGLQRYKQEKVTIAQGDILLIERSGKITRGEFDDSRLNVFNRYHLMVPPSYTDDTRWYAYHEGMSEAEFDALLEWGFTPSEIVDMLYDRESYEDCFSDLYL